MEFFSAKHPIESGDLERVLDLLEEAMPADERRIRQAQRELILKDAYRLSVLRGEDDILQAFLAYWELPGFTYVEHFAVDKALRGHGIGQQMLAELLQRAHKPVVLEVELPETDIARRRIGFYERSGLHLNPYPYLQPPLQGGFPPLPLRVMSWPEPLSKNEFDKLCEELILVYGTRPVTE